MKCPYCQSNTILPYKINIYQQFYKCSICNFTTKNNPNHNFAITVSKNELEQRSSNYRKTLVFSEHSDFKNDLVKLISDELPIKYMICDSSSDVWLRDTFFDTNNDNVYVRSKSTSRDSKLNINDIKSQLLLLNSTNRYLSRKKYYSDSTFIAKYKSGRNISSISNCFNDGVAYKETIRPLEGGNLFEAVNLSGQKCYIIGENALLNETDYQKIKGNINYKSNFWHKRNNSYFEESIRRYKKIFKTDNVYSLPQWTYHLDLQISYVGKSIFLVHSFHETSIFLTKNYLRDEYNICRENISRIEPCVDEIIEILQSLGFIAIKCCAVLHKHIKKLSMETMKHEDYLNLTYGQGISSSFINGITLSICS